MAATDYFELFDLPRSLLIDADTLQRRFHDLSRKFHPDLHEAAIPAIRARLERQSMVLNEAYRTLREPKSRLDYLIHLEIGADPSSAGSSVPLDLFDLVDQTHDLLAEAAAAQGALPDELRQRVTTLRDEVRAAQEARWTEIHRIAGEWDANEQSFAYAEVDADTYGQRRQDLLSQLRKLQSELPYIDRMMSNLSAVADGGSHDA